MIKPMAAGQSAVGAQGTCRTSSPEKLGVLVVLQTGSAEPRRLLPGGQDESAVPPM
jgi:hypothetical protein